MKALTSKTLYESSRDDIKVHTDVRTGYINIKIWLISKVIQSHNLSTCEERNNVLWKSCESLSQNSVHLVKYKNQNNNNNNNNNHNNNNNNNINKQTNKQTNNTCDGWCVPNVSWQTPFKCLSIFAEFANKLQSFTHEEFGSGWTSPDMEGKFSKSV